jgi:putative ABC transport system permease protein
MNFRAAFIVLQQVVESAVFAMHALRSNRVRTFLSTLGITIGIFCIIMVLTIVESLERNLHESVESLGKDVTFIQKWPWSFTSDYKWWKYMNRPNPTLSELKRIEAESEYSQAQALTIDVPTRTLKYGSNTAEQVGGMAVSHNYKDVRSFEIMGGRYFTDNESANGANVVLIGAGIAENLFPNLNPVDRELSLSGNKFRVVGVFKKEGESIIGNSLDNVFIIPVRAATKYIRINSKHVNSTLLVKAKNNVPVNMMEEELRGIMRSAHKLRPGQEEDFALNKTTLISEPLKETFKIVSFAGWIIGGFAMLVGGFGIANIMFVSVKERTGQIGIQKSLGAKNYFILIEFLVEAIILCLVGGAIGILFVWGITEVVKATMDINVFLSAGNILTGLFVSIFIGLLSGFIPAFSASRLDPVEAIRAK